METRERSSVQGVHHVALRTHRFDDTIRFYTEGLGFAQRYGWGTGAGRVALLDAGNGCYLEVFARAADDSGTAGPFFHIALRVVDVDAAVEAAQAAGAVVAERPKDIVLNGAPPMPARIAFVQGLAGERIEFFQSAGRHRL